MLDALIDLLPAFELFIVVAALLLRKLLLPVKEIGAAAQKGRQRLPL